MKPRAALAASRCRKVETSRLEVRTTAGRDALRRVNSAQTVNPSTSGSATSSRTTSGSQRATVASAEAPSYASPTTR